MKKKYLYAKINHMKKLSVILLSLALVGVYAILTSGRCKTCFNPGSTPAATVEKNMTVTIWSPHYPWSSPRKTYPYPTPADPRLGYGSTSASSLSQTSSGKFYAIVKVQNLGSTSWGQQGIKTYVWTSPSNSMVVQVPSNYQFKLSVEFFERCGAHYTDSMSSGRSKWILNSGTTGWVPIFSFNQNWVANGRLSCY